MVDGGYSISLDFRKEVRFLRLVDSFKPRPKILRNGDHADIPCGVWRKAFPWALLMSTLSCLFILSEIAGVIQLVKAGKAMELCMITLSATSIMTSAIMSACYWITHSRKYYLADIPCERKDRIWIIALLLVMWPFLIVSGVCMLRYKRAANHTE